MIKRIVSTALCSCLTALIIGLFSSPLLAQEIVQPIDFSHKTHVKDNNVPCEYCHNGARRSTSSIVPPVRTCIGCHFNAYTSTPLVAGTTDQQKKEIKKILEYWENKEPIPWKKIHDLPDFVYFSHKRHIQAGFDCTQCHGDVSEVKVPQLFEIKGEIPQSMGWCMTCHRTDHPTVEGKISSPVRVTRGGPTQGNAPKSTGTLYGSTDCLVCHK